MEGGWGHQSATSLQYKHSSTGTNTNKISPLSWYTQQRLPSRSGSRPAPQDLDPGLTMPAMPAMPLRTWTRASMPTSVDNVAGVEVEHAGTDVR